MANMTVKIIKADYLNSQHARDIPRLLDAYASDPMGGAQALPEQTKQNLVSELAKRPYAFSILAYVDEQAAGLINCFEAFSTFQCKPLINIHDVLVLKEYRGLGLSQLMLEKVEEIARFRGCCKLTLEILSQNEIAKSAYRKFGFTDFAFDPAIGTAQFWEKPLSGE